MVADDVPPVPVVDLPTTNQKVEVGVNTSQSQRIFEPWTERITLLSVRGHSVCLEGSSNAYRWSEKSDRQERYITAHSYGCVATILYAAGGESYSTES